MKKQSKLSSSNQFILDLVKCRKFPDNLLITKFIEGKTESVWFQIWLIKRRLKKNFPKLSKGKDFHTLEVGFYKSLRGILNAFLISLTCKIFQQDRNKNKFKLFPLSCI